MRLIVVISLLITGVLLGCVGYCVALTDWVTDITTGVYTRRPGEAFFETVGLLTYTCLGIRFFQRRVDFF
jgi:hypothetical protein